MDVVEAIRERRSIRAFKPDPVAQGILRQIMGQALRAPSYENVQPWEFAIVGGNKIEEIRQAFIKRAEEDGEASPDLPMPRGFPEPYNNRRRVLGRAVFEIKGISRDDKEKRRWWLLQGLKLFEAPNAIYVYTDRSLYFQGDALNVWPVFDCGLVAENIMLLCCSYGLGSIIQLQAAWYPDILRQTLGIPDSKLIVLGIAIGYPELDDPINQFRSERTTLDEVAKWYGFD